MKVLMLNLYGELEIWYSKESYILGNPCDEVIYDLDEIDALFLVCEDSIQK